MTESVIISVEGIQRFLGEEAQTVQIVTEGTMKTEGNTVYLSYEESEVTGMEGTTTTFTVHPERVELVRTGTVQSKMVFEKGKKDVSLYDVSLAPPGAIWRSPMALRSEKRPRDSTPLSLMCGVVKTQCRSKCWRMNR